MKTSLLGACVCAGLLILGGAACQPKEENQSHTVVFRQAVVNTPTPLIAPLPLLHDRYRILGNGSEVKDMETNLIWRRCQVGMEWNGTSCTGETKAVDFDTIQELTETDWRIPTIRELSSLIYCSSGKTDDADDVGDSNTPIKNTCSGEYSRPTIRTDVFPTSQDTIIWSGSINTKNEKNAWFINFNNGYIGNSLRSNNNGLRLIRNYNPPLLHNRYQILGNGSEIKDIETDLIWQRCQSGMQWDGITCTGIEKTYNFDEVSELVGNGWRMPTLLELATLIYCSSGQVEPPSKIGGDNGFINNWCAGDYISPTIRKDVFPQTYNDPVWSGTAHVENDTSQAWFIHFGGGGANYHARTNSYQIRLVRNAPR